MCKYPQKTAKYGDLTEEELEAEIEKKYGKDWRIEELDPKDELFEEVWYRLGIGY